MITEVVVRPIGDSGKLVTVAVTEDGIMRSFKWNKNRTLADLKAYYEKVKQAELLAPAIVKLQDDMLTELKKV